MWRLVTPLLLVVILAVTFLSHKPMTYGDYVYPEWANSVGWLVTSASVAFIPLVAVFKVANSTGGLCQVLHA